MIIGRKHPPTLLCARVRLAMPVTRAFIGIIAAAFLAVAAAQCPEGFFLYDSASGSSKCFYYSAADDKRSWDNARTTCEQMAAGAQLACPSDVDQNDVIGIYNKEDSWIGLNDHAVENQWTWLDGTPFAYTRWKCHFFGGACEPNSFTGNEDCGALRDDNKWEDEDCSLERRYWCQAPPCDDGYVCSSGTPVPCGGNEWFCKGGVKTSVDTGHFSVGGSGATTRTAQLACDEAGHYCEDGVKFPCPAGRFASTASTAWTSDCEGLCSAGHWCGAGSTSATAAQCEQAREYCPAGSASPVPATPGFYTTGGDATGALATAQLICPAGSYCVHGARQPCPAGRFGAAPGLASSACTGACPPGFVCPEGTSDPTNTPCGGPGVFCPEGATSAVNVDAGYYSGPLSVAQSARSTQQECEPGYYCVGGMRHPCAAGRYGTSAGETSPQCSGLCAAGYFCPEASSSSTALPCGAGYYCIEGTSAPASVGTGHYATPTSDLEHATSQKECEKAFYCVSGERFACPAGRFGGDERGLHTSVCSRACTAGYYCPEGATQEIACGGAQWFCPLGGGPTSSGGPLPVSDGHYSIGGTTTTRSGQAPCEAGSYCIGGIKLPCPVGRYGATELQSSSQCSGPCSEGWECPPGTVDPTPCRATSVFRYCTGGVSIEVGPGNYSIAATIGGENVLVSEAPAPTGHWAASGALFPCSAGFYNPDEGKTSCPTECTVGYYCPEGSSEPLPCGEINYYCPRAAGVPLQVESGYYSTPLSAPESTRTSQAECPAGYWCSSGARHACPAGKYQTETGQTSAAACLPCQAGCACPSASSSACPLPCRSPIYFCPAEASSRQLVSSGHYATVGGGFVDDEGRPHFASQVACSAGTYCDGGEQFNCPAGRWSRDDRASSCDGVCQAGYFCPAGSTSATAIACDTPDAYCPAGITSPVQTPAGYYATSGDAAAGLYAAVQLCEAGHYCRNGVRRACAAGRYGSEDGLFTSWCSGLCPPGRVCAEQSTFAGDVCGAASLYCPLGSSTRGVVPDGYVNTAISLGEAVFAEDFVDGEQLSVQTATSSRVTTACGAATGSHALVMSSTVAGVALYVTDLNLEHGGVLSLQYRNCNEADDITGQETVVAAVLTQADQTPEAGVALVVGQASDWTHTNIFIPAGTDMSVAFVPRWSGGFEWAVDSIVVMPLVTAEEVGVDNGALIQPCGSVQYWCASGERHRVRVGFYAACDRGEEYCTAELVCPDGFYCEGDGRQIACSAGESCPSGSSAPDVSTCSQVGMYCPGGEPVAVDDGYLAVLSEEAGAHVSQEPCGSSAHFCKGGIKTRIRTGYYGVGDSVNTLSAELPCGDPAFYCSAGQRFEVEPGYESTGGAPTERTGQAACVAPRYWCSDGVPRVVPVGNYSVPEGPGNPRLGHSVCPRGSYCVDGTRIDCPAGRYGTRLGQRSVDSCLLCPPGTFSNSTAATSEQTCSSCPSNEGSDAGAAECWPGLVEARAVASQGVLYPAEPGLSRGDAISLRFTRALERIDWDTHSIDSFLSVSSPVMAASLPVWRDDGRELLVQVLSVADNVDLAATAVGSLSVALHADQGVSVRSASRLSHGTRTTINGGASPCCIVQGSWGSHPPPVITSLIARDGEPLQRYPGAGDTLTVMFDREVTPISLANKEEVDAMFEFSAILGANYHGAWLDSRTAQITVDVAHSGSEAWSHAVDVGSLRVTPKASAGLTALDGDSPPASQMKLLDAGTWGDLPSDVEVEIHSATSLLVGWKAPTPATGFRIDTFEVEYSTEERFLPEHTQAVTVSDDTEVVLQGLATDVGIFVRVRADSQLAFEQSGPSSGPVWGPWAYPPVRLPVAPAFPTIEQIPAAQFLGSEGGQVVVLIGRGFGAASNDVTAEYENDDGRRYSTGQCAVVSSQQLECQSVPGVGVGFRWRVTVNGFVSEWSEATTSYAPPTVSAFEGEGVAGADTAGGQQVIVRGTGFGFEQDGIDGVQYAAAGRSDAIFQASSCTIVEPHVAIACDTVEGAGAELKWLVTVASQPSRAPTTWYERPSISAVARPGASSLSSLATRGGELIVLHGRGFGPAGEQSLLDSVRYGRFGAGSSGTWFTATHCRVVEAHVKVECLTAPGYGAGHVWVVTVHGQESLPSPVSNQTSYGPPVITSVSPPTSPTPGGLAVRLHGHNFGDGASLKVTLAGEAISGATAVTHSTVEIQVPPGTGRHKQVFIEVGGQVSNEATFAYDPPHLMGIDVLEISPDGTSLMTLTGSSFGSEPEVLTVAVGSTPCSVQTVTHTNIQCWTNQQVGRVTVVVDGQAAFESADSGLTHLFNLQDLLKRPIIEDVEPLQAGTIGGVNITITGANFKTDGSVLMSIVSPTAITAAAGLDEQECEVMTWSAGEIICTLPEGQGAYDLQITTGTLDSPPLRFVYDAPAIVSVSPTAVSTLGGIVTISGQNFGVGGAITVEGTAPVPLVSLETADGGASGSSGDGAAPQEQSVSVPCVVVAWDHEEIQCQLDAGSISPLTLRVAVSGGQKSEAVNLNREAPVILEITPASVATTGGELLNVSGANFGTAGSVDIGGRPCVVESFNHTLIQCWSPPGVGSSSSVVVRSTHLESSAGAILLSYAPPVVHSITWVDGAPTVGGFEITITGENFGSPELTAAEVSLSRADDGGIIGACVALLHSHTAIVCSAPAGVGGNISVTVDIAGQGATMPRAFSYDAPVVQAVRPNVGDAHLGNPGTVISGRNFGANKPSSVLVRVGDEPCDNVIWIADDELRCDTRGNVAVGNRTLAVSVNNLTSTPVLVFTECSNGQFGSPGELCNGCPQGAVCPGGAIDPYPLEGYWRLSRAEFLACSPTPACPGGPASPCATGYFGEACSECSAHHYRLRSECVPCPDTAWLYLAAFVVGVCMLLGFGVFLNKRRINLSGLSIGVDFLQICSMFSSFDFAWPAEAITLFDAMSASSLNIDIAAPQCALPFTYANKFALTQGLPIMLLGFVALTWLSLRLFMLAQRFCLVKCGPLRTRKRGRALDRSSSQQKGDEDRSEVLLSSSAADSVNDAAIGVIFTALYYLFLVLVNSALEVFDCNVNTNGKITMDAEPSIECGVGVHATLRPFAIASLFVYGLGIPVLFGTFVWAHRNRIQFDQTLRARGEGDNPHSNPAYYIRRRYRKLYEDFRPERYYWRFVLLARKFALAAIALMFNQNPM